MKGENKRVICPVCKYERWTELSDVLLPRHILQIAMISILLMAISFPWIDTKVILIPLPVIFCFEVVRTFVNRARVICPQCDYDPILYKIDRNLARKKCETRLIEIAHKLGRKIDLGTQDEAPRNETPPTAA